LADWLVEEGIAEHRAVRIAGDRIVEARVEWPGRLAAGWVIEGRLASRTAGSTRGTALAESGEEVLVDRLPKDAREGASLRIAIVRAALEGPGRFKRAQGRPSDAPLAQPPLAARLGASSVRRFPAGDWDDLVDEALAGKVVFPAGALLFAPTPAMTTIDIDGNLPARALALAAIPELAGALRRFDLGGSVAIDFPTLQNKADRRAVDEALGAKLGDWPHERTAMNGFGLVQLVARLERPSLLHLATWQRHALVWRRLLRRAEALEGAGAIELSIHPALERAIEADHVAALERRSGSRVKLRKAATLAPEAPLAQRVAE
jgi:hypothetical protein